MNNSGKKIMQHFNYPHNESSPNNYKYLRASKRTAFIFASLGLITGGSLLAIFIVPEYYHKADVSKFSNLMDTTAEKNITDVNNCRFTTKGIEYKGKVNHTMSGNPCQRWDTDEPHEKKEMVKNDKTIRYEENYCRNPDADWSPWCYTTDEDIRYQYCYIPMCSGSTKSDGNIHNILELLKQKLSKNNVETLLTSLIVDCTGTWLNTLKVINKQFPTFCNEAIKGYVLNHTASGIPCQRRINGYIYTFGTGIEGSSNIYNKPTNQCMVKKDYKWCDIQ